MLLSVLYLFLLQVKVSASEPVISLKIEDIKNLVETRNERVTSKSHQESAMESRQGYLKRSFFPTLRVYGAQERFELGSQYRRTQPTYGAEMSINLFNGTKDKLSDDMIDKKKERIQTEKKVTLYQEVIRAKEIYWTVIYLDKIVDSLNQIKDLNRKNLNSAQKRIRAGVTTKADSFEFEIKNTEMDRDIAQAAMQKKMLLRELGVLLGFEEGRMINLIGDLQHMESMEKIGSHSEIQHQFLAKPFLVQAEENEMEAKIQARSWWPRVDAYVAQNQYNVRTGNVFDRQEGKETVTGIRLTMNLFDFTSGNREAKALQSEANGTKSEAKYLEKQIENEAHAEIAQIDFLHQQVHDAEENIKRAEKYYQVTMSEYSRGVKNSPDVLGAVDKLQLMKIKYYEILKDFYVVRDHLKTKSEI